MELEDPRKQKQQDYLDIFEDILFFLWHGMTDPRLMLTDHPGFDRVEPELVLAAWSPPLALGKRACR